MQAGLHLERQGFESSAGKPVWQGLVKFCRAVYLDVWLRMQVELQLPMLDVAGSNPAGFRKEAVAQW